MRFRFKIVLLFLISLFVLQTVVNLILDSHFGYEDVGEFLEHIASEKQYITVQSITTEEEQLEEKVLPKYRSPPRVIFTDLDLDGEKDRLHFMDDWTELGYPRTEVYLDYKKVTSLDGAFLFAGTQDIEKDGKQEVVIEVLMGKLTNTRLFRFESGNLYEIQLGEDSESVKGVLGALGAEFKDIDRDSIDEMFVYHRFYPPEKRRTAVVYKFDGKKFIFFEEYEEQTEDIFL